nr:hypothetical protein [Dyella sp. ASV24]
MKRTRATLAATLWLALAFSPLALATSASTSDGVLRQAQAQQPSGSEINGRVDWNVDYPSQLEPLVLHPSRSDSQTEMSDIAQAQAGGADARAPAHPEP